MKYEICEPVPANALHNSSNKRSEVPELYKKTTVLQSLKTVQNRALSGQWRYYTGTR